MIEPLGGGEVGNTMKREAADHPKLWDLVDRLPEPYQNRFAALGLLEALTCFCAKFTPRGDIGAKSDAAIARWLGWPCAPSELIDALVESEWLDRSEEHRLLVHDWPQHADKYTHRAVIRALTTFADGTPPRVSEGTEKERAAYLAANVDTVEGVDTADDVDTEPEDPGEDTDGDPGEVPAGTQEGPTRDTGGVEYMGSGSGSGSSSSSGVKNKSRPRARPPPRELHARAMPLAEMLRDQLTEHIEHFRAPSSLESWAADIDKLIRINSVPPPDIEAVIRWLHTSDFWRKNVLSGKALRKQFARLHDERKTEAKGPARPARPSATDAWKDDPRMQQGASK